MPFALGGFYRSSVYLLCSLALAACGGGGGEGGGGDDPGTQPPPESRTVTLTWDANRESGVNRPGGGYEVSIAGQPVKDVPYTSGPTAPTSTTSQLPPGTYVISVRAYAGLDPQGGNNRNFSASQGFTLNVP
jgi:hypothetical protein